MTEPVSDNSSPTLIDVIDGAKATAADGTEVKMVAELKSQPLDGLAVGVHDYVSISIGVAGGEPEEVFQIHGVSASYDADEGKYEVGAVNGLSETDDKLVVLPYSPDDVNTKEVVGSAVLFETTDPNMIAAKMSIVNETIATINDKNLDYNPLLQNSNSVARALSEVLVDNPDNVPDIKGIEVGNQTAIISEAERGEIISGVYNQPMDVVAANDPMTAIESIDRDQIIETALESHVKSLSMEGMGEPDVAGDAGLAARAAEQAGADPSVVTSIAPKEPEAAPAPMQQQPAISSPAMDFAY